MPAGVQLVDDDVGAGVALACVFVVTPSTMSRSTGSCAQASITCACPSSHGSTARGRRAGAGCRSAATGANARRSSPGGIDVRLGHPAHRVVGADDLGVGALAEGELVRASCRGCPSRGSGRRSSFGAARRSGNCTDLARASARSRSGRRRSAAAAVRARRTACASRRGSAPCRSSDQSASGWSLPAVEDDEPCVDPLTPQRLHVLPRDAGDVDRAVRDPKRHRHAGRPTPLSTPAAEAAAWVGRLALSSRL